MIQLLNRLADPLFPQPTSIPTVPASSGLFSSVLQVAFGAAGILAVLIITLAAFQYVLSQGDPKRTAKAKNTIIYALIGLVVAMAGYSIVTFVIGKVVG